MYSPQACPPLLTASCATPQKCACLSQQTSSFWTPYIKVAARWIAREPCSHLISKDFVSYSRPSGHVARCHSIFARTTSRLPARYLSACKTNTKSIPVGCSALLRSMSACAYSRHQPHATQHLIHTSHIIHEAIQGPTSCRSYLRRLGMELA